MPNPEFLLWTDGSGHTDGFGGWACLARSYDGKQSMFRMGAVIGTTVDRMEMTAMLEGLQMVLELKDTLPEPRRFVRTNWAPRVVLYSDRENMVLSIQKVYQRSNCIDLWKRFEYYEAFLTIEAIHVSRETDYPEFVAVDLHASTARVIAKSYAETVCVPPNQLLLP